MACGTADIAAIRSAACCYDSTLGDFRKKVYLQLFSLQLLLPPCPTELFLRLFAPSAVLAYNKQPQDAPPQRLPPLQNPLTTAPAPSTVCIRRSAPRQAASAYLSRTDKLHKHGRRLPHLVTQHPRSPSAEEAVTNILYNTPPPSTEPFKRSVYRCPLASAVKPCKAD